jgi:hypothetical protein
MVGFVIGLIGLVLVAIGAVALAFKLSPSAKQDEAEHLMGWHQTYGEWRVRYPDGKISQPFSRQVAEDYAEMFGGEVIPKDQEES